jgi:hypothetical protein
MSTPEGQIVADILAYLKARRIYAWRQNTGAVKAHGRMVQYGKIGSSDILGILPGGRFLAIECKYGKADPTEAQRFFIEVINSQGGLAFVARSVEDVERGLKL